MKRISKTNSDGSHNNRHFFQTRELRKLTKLVLVIFFILFWTHDSFAQNIKSYYQFSVDLSKVNNDKVLVELVVPRLKNKEVIYNLPKIVPGTYAIHNYGSYVSQFLATDKYGNRLEVEQIDKNSWKIFNSKKLHKLSYNIDDSWDTPEIKEDIFEPAGTNIQQDTLFLINTFGFFGYFKGYEKTPFQVSIKKPENIYGSTALPRTKRSSTEIDIFRTPNYHRLADCPIMYSKPDTTWLGIGNTKILVSAYSPTGKTTSKALARDIKPVLEAHSTYLGGRLPVNNYTFIFYLSNKENLTRYGALEHSHSSVYFLPEAMSEEQFSSTVKDMTSHEFFHIVTPLGIHSEEIGNFDFINPKMSKHLWLYEGITEYASHHSQLKAGVIDFTDYLDKQLEMIRIATTYFNDSLPFTELSSKTFEEHRGQYQNVYYKGALIGLCLDIKLRQLSKGKYGIQELLKDLAKRYGENKSFKDDLLFDEIADMTFPEIRDFFRSYVEGTSKLPLQDVFKSIGVEFDPNTKSQELEVAFNIGFGLTEDGQNLYIAKADEMTSLARRLAFQEGDVLISFNGKRFTLQTYAEIFQEYQLNAKEGDVVNWVVSRKINDNVEEITLSAILQLETTYSPTLKINDNLTEQQKQLKLWWMGR